MQKPWESHEKTVVFKEYSRLCGETDTPYYRIRLVAEKTLLLRYVSRARDESGVTFVGRLGTYRYIDMHVTIAEALDTAERFKESMRTDTGTGRAMPAFMVDPLG